METPIGDVEKSFNFLIPPQVQQVENVQDAREVDEYGQAARLAPLQSMILVAQESNTTNLLQNENYLVDSNQERELSTAHFLETENSTTEPNQGRGEENIEQVQELTVAENSGQDLTVAENSEDVQRLGKKRQRNPNNWEKNKAKKARQAGQTYIDVSGKIKEARTLKEKCAANCRLKCRSGLNEETRKTLFSEFWSITSHEKKWEYLTKRVSSQPVKTKTTSWDSRRKESRNYSFRVDGKNIKICKTMFLNTLDINDAWVKTALQKQGSTSTLQLDSRRKNGKSRLKSQLVSSVKEHISAFPKVPSHYCRKDSNREYLDENLDIRKLYRFYVTWMAENYPTQLTIASERQYRDIFNNDFNLHFFKPKKDQCDVCFTWDHSTTEEKTKNQEDHDKHINAKNLARSMKDENKKTARGDETACVACFDLQKVLPCPRAESSAFYYKRHLSIYNFTVYDCTRNEGFCYLWNETIGKKGANEIASFLFDFIGKKANGGMKKFVFYSDNCAGQNRNCFVSSMFHLASLKYKVDIVHRFLEVGHTQNEGDSMHALIERKSKGVTIFTPDDWITIVKTAKTGKKPYVVSEIERENIFDFKDLANKQNWEKDVEGNKIYLSKIREISIKGDDDNKVTFRYDFDAKYKELFINKKSKGRPLSFLNYNLKCAYQTALSIDRLKLKDLLTLCNSGAIPSTRHAFYKSLNAMDKDNLRQNSDNDK